MESPKVVVIGAGIGGIAVAARLARHGYSVEVVEKCERAGGRCSRFSKDGHEFDIAPTLMLMPDIYAQTFHDLGERMEDHLDLRRVDPSYVLYFDDGSTLELTSDLKKMKAQLEELEPGSFSRYLSYLEEGRRHYEIIFTKIAVRNFRHALQYFNPRNLLLLFRLAGLTRHYTHMAKYFRTPCLKAAFTFQDMYVGQSPHRAPGAFSFLQYTELTDGVWFPMGGLYRVIQALQGIAEKNGASFRFQAPVDKIILQGGRVHSVALADGKCLPADLLVANADLPYVYNDLLRDRSASQGLMRKQYSCSTFNFYWALNRQFPQLGPHSLFLAGDYCQSFDRIHRELTLPEEPNFYVHAPVRLDPSLAPPGHDTLTVIVPVGHINDADPQDWPRLRVRARQAVLRRLQRMGIQDLEQHIKFEVCVTPLDWRERFNLVKGATHGLSHTLWQMGYLRPHNRHHQIGNLYFVGASTHPGTGLPTVLLSAKLTSERILEDATTRLSNSRYRPH